MASESSVVVRQVWKRNLACEFEIIESLLPHFHCVAMDTKFPGCVFTNPSSLERKKAEDRYKLLKLNVDAMKPIQLGLTLFGARGVLPDFDTDCSYVWEFNFSDFDFSSNLKNVRAVAMLEQKGVNFERNKNEGIASQKFAELMLSSGLAGKNVNWVTFDGSYDLAYLVKMLTQKRLPENLKDFSTLVGSIFGYSVFDTKYMASRLRINGDLERVATLLEVAEPAATGNAHLAGSDSLLTCHTFLDLVDRLGQEEALKFAGILHGLYDEGPFDRLCTVWNPPPRTFLKANFDGSCVYATGCCGAGIVIRDSEGRTLLTASVPLKDLSIAETEMKAFRLTLLFLTAFFPRRRVIVEGDSEIVVEAARREYSRDSSMLPKSSSIRHAYREGNQVADLLAKHGSDLAREEDMRIRYWFGTVPRFVVPGISSDLFLAGLSPAAPISLTEVDRANIVDLSTLLNCTSGTISCKL